MRINRKIVAELVERSRGIEKVEIVIIDKETNETLKSYTSSEDNKRISTRITVRI